MRESNYAEDIRIDETVLDIEWLEQPALMFKYAKLTAEAKQALDKAKDKVDYVRAELDSKIRRDPREGTGKSYRRRSYEHNNPPKRNLLKHNKRTLMLSLI